MNFRGTFEIEELLFFLLYKRISAFLAEFLVLGAPTRAAVITEPDRFEEILVVVDQRSDDVLASRHVQVLDGTRRNSKQTRAKHFGD